MQIKLMEIRDRATFIPVVAIKLVPRAEEERYLLGRAGYSAGRDYILLSRITGDKNVTCCDPYAWGDRTMTVAHDYLEKHWDALYSGQVIDVEYILGETASPKKSERE